MFAQVQASKCWCAEGHAPPTAAREHLFSGLGCSAAGLRVFMHTCFQMSIELVQIPDGPSLCTVTHAASSGFGIAIFIGSCSSLEIHSKLGPEVVFVFIDSGKEFRSFWNQQ